MLVDCVLLHTIWYIYITYFLARFFCFLLFFIDLINCEFSARATLLCFRFKVQCALLAPRLEKCALKFEFGFLADTVTVTVEFYYLFDFFATKFPAFLFPLALTQVHSQPGRSAFSGPYFSFSLPPLLLSCIKCIFSFVLYYFRLSFCPV